VVSQSVIWVSYIQSTHSMCYLLLRSEVLTHADIKIKVPWDVTCLTNWYLSTKVRGNTFQKTRIILQWNLDFTSLQPTFALILFTFLWHTPKEFCKGNAVNSLKLQLFFPQNYTIIPLKWAQAILLLSFWGSSNWKSAMKTGFWLQYQVLSLQK